MAAMFNARWHKFFILARKHVLPIFNTIRGNFYLSSASIFILWIAFFDSNDLVSMIRNRFKLNKIEQEIRYYDDQIAALKEAKGSLNSNKELLEKFAREQYLFKRANEDIYLLEYADR